MKTANLLKKYRRTFVKINGTLGSLVNHWDLVPVSILARLDMTGSIDITVSKDINLINQVINHKRKLSDQKSRKWNAEHQQGERCKNAKNLKM